MVLEKRLLSIRLLWLRLTASALLYGSLFNPRRMSSKAPLYTSSCWSSFFSRTAFVFVFNSFMTASWNIQIFISFGDFLVYDQLSDTVGQLLFYQFTWKTFTFKVILGFWFYYIRVRHFFKGQKVEKNGFCLKFKYLFQKN